VGHDRHSTVQAVDQSLRLIRFEPRPSLEAELLWRLRRDGAGRADEPETLSIPGLIVIAGLVLGVLVSG
jgi:hypothetical protein